MKSLSAILFSLLLVLAQFAPASATAVCCQPAMNCSAACRQMPCCAAKTSSTQSAPVVPMQKSGAQNQILLLTSAVALWTLPENPAHSISSVTASPSLAMAAPLYARNCSRLL